MWTHVRPQNMANSALQYVSDTSETEESDEEETVQLTTVQWTALKREIMLLVWENARLKKENSRLRRSESLNRARIEEAAEILKTPRRIKDESSRDIRLH